MSTRSLLSGMGTELYGVGPKASGERGGSFLLPVTPNAMATESLGAMAPDGTGLIPANIYYILWLTP